MGKKFAVALALVALMAAPAFASVQNVKVGGSLATTSVIRSSFDLGANPQSQTVQNVVLSQVGLTVQADLTDNVSTNLRLVNERLWGQYDASSANANVDIDTAYVTMKELLYSPLTLTVGRQPLVYGNQFLIGDGDLTTKVGAVTDITGGSNFDAVKAVLSYNPLTVDLFAAKTAENGTVQQNGGNDNTNLYGVNANYKLGDKMSTVVEAYTFARMNKSVIDATQTKAENLYVPGLRVSTNPIEGLNLQLEGSYEIGDGATVAGRQSKTRAYGLQGMANYALPVMKNMKPVVSAGYTLLSGDKSSTDTRNTAFDPLFENQKTGRIFDSLFAQSNMHIINLAAEVTPVQDLTAKLTWFDLMEQKAVSSMNLNQPDGTTGLVTAMTDKKLLGNEFDLDLTYAYTEDVKFGLSAGTFLPGKAFSSANKDSASQVLSSVSVAF